MIYLKALSSAVQNIVSNYTKNKLTYLIESRGWSIGWDGFYITKNLNSQKLLKSRLSFFPFFLKNQIIHFGSENILPFNGEHFLPHKSNKLVFSIFHIDSLRDRYKNLLNIQKRINYIHTSSSLSKKELINMGFSKEKVIVIPLGVDLSLFNPASHGEKMELRRKYGLPVDRLIIGSFQKDGIGWGEGYKPKLIKGPDIFVDTIIKLKKYKPFILLTGPSRGYVKNRLEENGIEYAHYFFQDYRKIADCYKILDLYLISSRVEGGPKSLLESMASGIPVVSTRVGMVVDIGKNLQNVLMADFNPKDLATKSKQIFENDNLKNTLVEKGLQTAKKFDWSKIAKNYYKEMYKKLI